MIPIADKLKDIAPIITTLYDAVMYQLGSKSENKVIFYELNSLLTIVWISGVKIEKNEVD